MKKKLIIIGVAFCSLLVALIIMARITGMLLIYSVPTPANEPNVKMGDKIYVSNIKDPVPYNFVVITSTYADSINMVSMAESEPGSRYFYRLCAIPGDVIEMKNGIFYSNGKIFDKPLNLNLQYKISNAELIFFDEDDLAAIEKSSGMIMRNGDSSFVGLDSILLKKYASQINPVRYIVPHFENGPFKWNNKDAYWTTDNFGPLKIPTGCYFVLGDNRHNAMDSRYIGFVKKEGIKGVVLNK